MSHRCLGGCGVWVSTNKPYCVSCEKSLLPGDLNGDGPIIASDGIPMDEAVKLVKKLVVEEDKGAG